MLVSQSVTDKIDDEAVRAFQRDGFHVHAEYIFQEAEDVSTFCHRLEAVLNSEYDTGVPPYKVNKVPAEFRIKGRFTFEGTESPAAVPKPGSNDGAGARRPKATIHVINIWQADSMFRRLVTDTALGAAVVRLMGWEGYGCRVAQDQVWIKPPHSGPLTYHRDTPYLDFVPKEVCTVWIPFDAIATPEVGTLEYCVGSHKWGEERRGSANQFYNADYKALLRSAAEAEAATHRSAAATSEHGTAPADDATNLSDRVVTVLGCAGCCSFHDGNTWHGSRANTTGVWRRGIGIHYVRGDSVLAADAGKLWRDLCGMSTPCELSPQTFPFAAPAAERSLTSL